MQRFLKITLLLMLLLSVFGCYGYRAYMGLHGKSIKLYPDVHESSFTEDSKCLECHHPDHPQGPPSPHPNFTGCIECHSDEINSD